jgi:DNA uptake protein ComE-like DNA-binding protein
MNLKRPSLGAFFVPIIKQVVYNIQMAKTETTESPTKLFQDEKTGKLVEFLSVFDKDYAKVRDASGNIIYVTLEQLVPYHAEKGRLAKITAPMTIPEPEEAPPVTAIPAEDVRLNMNAASAEQIQKRLPGVGYTTAKRIIELRMSLSGERFSNLKQLENIPRVNWEQVIKEDLIFIG